MFAVGVAVVKKGLDGDRPCLDLPRAVGLLCSKQEVDPALIGGVADRDAGGLEHEECLTGGVSVAFEVVALATLPSSCCVFRIASRAESISAGSASSCGPQRRALPVLLVLGRSLRQPHLRPKDGGP